jgi:hypothetical protein
MNTQQRFPLLVAFTLFVAACSSTPQTSSDESDLNATPACGGKVGLKCHSGKTCVDDPKDDCDPATGGRDCSGICVQLSTQPKCGGLAGLTCATTFTCVDDPTDACDPATGGRDCAGICVKGAHPTTTTSDGGAHSQVCGGFAGLACPAGQKCVDDPSDACDPNKGGADCPGICAP